LVEGFTTKYNTTQLVYYEIFDDIQLAADREKRLKEWKRQWKIDLIQKMNPTWQELCEDIYPKRLATTPKIETIRV
jgi:putative endonuclease